MRANEQKYKVLMAKARKVNKERDAIDRASGFAAPPDTPVGALIATAMTAIESGIRQGDWDCVAEGLAMLQDDKRVKALRPRA